MLLALLTMWLLGGDADVRPVLNDQIVREVRNVVVDEQRASAIVSAIKDFDRERSAYFDAIDEAIEDLIDINRQHEASRSQYEALLQNADVLRDSAREQFITSVFEIREQLSEAEWAAVVAAVREQ